LAERLHQLRFFAFELSGACTEQTSKQTHTNKQDQKCGQLKRLHNYQPLFVEISRQSRSKQSYFTGIFAREQFVLNISKRPMQAPVLKSVDIQVSAESVGDTLQSPGYTLFPLVT